MEDLQGCPKPTPNLVYLAGFKNSSRQQLLVTTPNLFTLGKNNRDERKDIGERGYLASTFVQLLQMFLPSHTKKEATAPICCRHPPRS
jgi:hypothetical protein